MLGMNNLPQSKANKTKKRVGRGNASTGTYSGRGMKGQKSRAGASGMLRLAARDWVQKLPKRRGFTSLHTKPAWVDVTEVAAKCTDGKVNPQILKSVGLISTTKYGVKILGSGPVKVALTVEYCKVSQGARKAIEAAGGSIVEPKDKQAEQDSKKAEDTKPVKE